MAYTLAFSSQHANELEPDDRLRLSGMTFGPSDMSTYPQTVLFALLSQTAVRPKARSLFVATSGHGGVFDGVGELVRTVRRGVHLNEHAIPTVENNLDPELPLNAYLYDFFVDGQVDALVNMNGTRRGDVWYALEAFHLVLVTIRGDLENLLLRTSRDSAPPPPPPPPPPLQGCGTGRRHGGCRRVEGQRVSFSRPIRPGGRKWKRRRVAKQVPIQLLSRDREAYLTGTGGCTRLSTISPTSLASSSRRFGRSTRDKRTIH